MDLLHLVDRLEEIVASAQKMPIGSKAIVDRRRLLDVVDQMRVAIPQEVRDAQEMVARRDEQHREAEEEARLVIARAEDRAARMVEQHEITLAARKRAEEIAHIAETRLEERVQQANDEIEARIADSRRISGQQMDAADEYARELLGRLDRQLLAFVRSVQSGLDQLQAPGHPEVPVPPPLGSRPGTSTSERIRLAAEEAEDADGAPVVMDDEADEDGYSPLRLRRADPRDGAPHDPDAPSDEEFQDLLHRRTPRPAVQPLHDAPGIIDDFAMPALDDQPGSTTRRDRED